MAAVMAMTFGERLRQMRLDAGLTQQQLADAAGVHRQVVAKLEGGDSKSPRWDTVVALARALGVSVAAFEDDSTPSLE